MNRFLFHTAFKYRISRHLAFFTGLVLVFTLVLYSRSNGQQFFHFLNLTVANAIIFLGYGYLTIFVLIPYLLPERRFLIFSVSFLGLGLSLSFIKFWISDFIFYSSISPEFGGSQGLLNFRFLLVNTKDMSFVVALMVIAKFTKDWFLVESQHLALQKRYDELILKLQQSHFEPHFLFNTLNNLYALSLKNQDQTVDVVRKFKRVLQFLITNGQNEKVLLLSEVEMIGDYIAIEQIRYGSRLQVKTRVSGTCEGLLIAPFILFSLVENCFKHGSSIDAGNPWIELSLSCENRRICFETRNSVPKKSVPPNLYQEKELTKLKQRLEMVYPKKYSLTLKEDERQFAVTLKVDLT